MLDADTWSFFHRQDQVMNSRETFGVFSVQSQRIASVYDLWNMVIGFEVGWATLP